MVIILAWAVYRLNKSFLALLERVGRQDRRINEVLFQATRNRKPKEKTETPTFVDLAQKEKIEEEVFCTSCRRKYPLSAGKCPFCGTPQKKTGEMIDIPDFPDFK